MTSKLFNSENDGTCRTLKANYAKSSYLGNFLRRGSFGVTGVIEIID